MSEPTAPVNDRVAALVNDLIDEAVAAGHDHLADRLRTEGARWRETETTVVVVGEPGRGKSSLVNALIGRPLLSADRESSTTSFVAVGHGSPERAVVHRRGAADEVVDIDAGADHAASADPDIDGVTVTVDHPLLADGLVLVDTPGAGALDAGAGVLTLGVIGRADALLFVVGPDEPLGRAELDFLEAATERLDVVLFVMAKVDRAPEWRTIADDDRALVARHARRFSGAPIIPVSARMKAIADEEGDTQLAEESGVPALARELLRSVVARRAAVRLANLLRSCAAVVEETASPLEAVIEAAAGASDARQAVERHQAALEHVRDLGERLNVEVTDRFNALREQAGADFARRVRELTASFGDPRPGVGLDELLDELRADLRGVCAEIAEDLGRHVDEIATDVVAKLEQVAIDHPELVISSPPVPIDAGAPADSDGLDATARLRVASTMASGGTAIMIFARALGGNPVLMAVMGVGALMALTTATLNVRLLRRQSDAAAVRKQIQESLAAAQGEVTPALRQEILAAQRSLERALRTAIRTRIKDLQQLVADATELARSDAAERQRRAADARQALGRLIDRRRQVATFRDEVEHILRPQRRPEDSS